MTEVWGNACWQLFHSTAVNLNEDDVQLIPEILNLIYLICNNLPCPECTKHATQTLNRLQKNHINSKEKLIKCLWEFHNLVNKNAGNPFFTREKHDVIYKNKDLNKILKHWVIVMSQSWNGGDYHHMLHSMSRKKMIQRVVLFFNKNKNAFMQY